MSLTKAGAVHVTPRRVWVARARPGSAFTQRSHPLPARTLRPRCATPARPARIISHADEHAQRARVAGMTALALRSQVTITRGGRVNTSETHRAAHRGSPARARTVSEHDTNSRCAG
jgi:hypothetical protein